MGNYSEKSGRHIGVKTLAAGAVICLTLGSIAGCSDKSIDYEPDTGQETASGSDSLRQFAEAGKWDDTWNVIMADGTEKGLVVNADITVPDTDCMAVVDVEALSMDAEYKEQTLRAFFGNEEVYYHDAQHQSAEELEILIEQQEALLDKMEETGEAESDIAAEREELQQYREALQAAEGSAPEEAADFENCEEFQGTRDGVSYIVSFSKENGLTIEADPYGKGDRYYGPETMAGRDVGTHSEEMDPGVNTCSYSMEEARELADKCVEQLGLSYEVCISEEDLVWTSYESMDEEGKEVYEETMVYGYRFRYAAGVYGVVFREFGSYNTYGNMGADAEWDPQAEDFYDLEDEVYIDVTDAGIAYVGMIAPLMVNSVTDQERLLPLETIQSIMKSELTEHPDSYDFSMGNKFNAMELIYFRMKNSDEPGKYSYIPAWRLSRKGNTSYGDYTVTQVSHPVLVNAIDGNVIDWKEELGGWK